MKSAAILRGTDASLKPARPPAGVAQKANRGRQAARVEKPGRRASADPVTDQVGASRSWIGLRHLFVLRNVAITGQIAAIATAGLLGVALDLPAMAAVIG